MNKLYGITNIQVADFKNIDDLNQFLWIYNGNIIDIQFNNNLYYVIYKEVENNEH